MPPKVNKGALLGRRTLILKRLTEFNCYVDNLKDGTIVLGELKVRLSKISPLWDEFESLEEKIESFIDASESETYEKEMTLENEIRSTFENSFYTATGLAEEILENSSRRPQSPASVSSFPVTQEFNVKLPNLTIPTFSGNYEEWYSYINGFMDIVDKNRSLPDGVKIRYLKGSLRGEALSVVESLDSTAENYQEALNLLREHFENSALIVQKHLRDLFGLRKIDRDSAESIRNLLVTSRKHIRALKSLKQPTDSWDLVLVHLISTKFDLATYKEWQEEIPTKELPTMTMLTEFMERKCQILEAVKANQSNLSALNKASKNDDAKNSNRFCHAQMNDVSKTVHDCLMCSGSESHRLFHCPKFKELTVDERFKFAKTNRLCLLCLLPGHRLDNCKTKGCSRCEGAPHNSSLCRRLAQEHWSAGNQGSVTTHLSTPGAATPSPLTSVLDTSISKHPFQEDEPNFSTTTCTGTQPSSFLLSTALVIVHGRSGKQVYCRALLDSGSQSSFLMSSICDRVDLDIFDVSTNICGLNGSITPVNKCTKARISSRLNPFNRQLNMFVVPKITDYTPSCSIDISKLKLPSNVVLADPNFSENCDIEMLIGADLFWDIIGRDQFKLEDNSLTFTESKFGWIASGECLDKPSSTSPGYCCHIATEATLESIDSTLRKFWETEEMDSVLEPSNEDIACENHFVANTSRNELGRYVVKMPFDSDIGSLGSSRDLALKRFVFLEKRLARDEELHIRYKNFIQEYIHLGQMALIDPNETPSNVPSFYVPHHPVFKETSSTTKLRVVFDFSAKSTSGLSLNDISSKGFVIQQSLQSHLLRSRTYEVFICGDLEKMYRQILINDEQTNLQKILWRDSPDEPLREYKLLTVSYGQTSSPWLATRTLKQLALDYKAEYLLSSESIMKHFYVDDYISGAKSVPEAIRLKDQITSHLSEGGFRIRKWTSNSAEFLESVPAEDREISPEVVFEDDTQVRTLGLIWSPSYDCFKYTVDHIAAQQNMEKPVTKRSVLSTIARIFDPLGLLGPISMKSKLFLRELWKQELDWDESLSRSLTKRWRIFCRTLSKIKDLRIPRKITMSNSQMFELHGLCDASMEGYGACIYLRCSDELGNVAVSLVTSKSRVAPVKTESLPRLELCGALLLAELMKNVVTSLEIPVNRIRYWTDSTVVLSWLQSTPSKWTTYVANRVSKIQKLSTTDEWNHVSSSENSADLLSRGSYADQLLDSDLWWKGPRWLSENIDLDDYGKFELVSYCELPDTKKEKIVALPTVSRSEKDFEIHINHALLKFTSFDRLVRVFAYVQRFLRCIKFKKGSRPTSPFTPLELDDARTTILRLAQRATFPQEVKDLSKNKTVNSSSKLLSLSPFLDSKGLIRVGGRLEHSALTPDKKHPIVLFNDSSNEMSKLTFIIARHFHLKAHHVGPQSLLALIREQYWPLNGKNLSKFVYHKCVICFKANPKTLNQAMGDLPEARVEPTRPFYHSGVDYAGPLLLKQSPRKNSPMLKCYIALFICLCTKCIHLELVHDLTPASFIAALRRFISRRGKPLNMYSDNGTTFVGANTELIELRNLWLSELHRNTIVDTLSLEGIIWKFIPPKSPNFGGLWESGVKQVKFHLKRIVGNSHLTFVELYTVLTQVEACINSRPIVPLSSDPNDLSALSPSHFLIGDHLLSTPEPDLKPLPLNRLSRWQLVQHLAQHFWTRWTSEYLQELQKRTKWKTSSQDLCKGALVLIKDDSTPPCAWPLGRVEEVHPGHDQRVRVVTVRTARGLFKRNVRNLCALPIDDLQDGVLKSTLQGGGNVQSKTPANAS